MGKRLNRLIALVCFGCVVHAQAAPPNILYILADDMGVGDIAALNADAKVKTPQLDALARGGMVFTDAHSSSSVCTPTRYSLLTGRYNWRSELKQKVVQGYSRALIAPGRDTVASLLKRNGYRTAMIGKWHLGLDWRLKDGSVVTELTEPKGIEAQIDFSKPFSGGPLDHGFESWYGINASLDFPPYTWIENDRVAEVPTIKRPYQGGKKAGQPELMMREGLQTEDFKPELVLKRLTEKAVEYIRGQKLETPFFLYLPLNAPHTPVVPRKEFLGSSQCGIYGDFVQEVDWAIGELTDALKQSGLFENTLIVFTADNGASRASFPPAKEEQYAHHPSGIYKGRKASLDEGGHRVPFIASWPASIKPGSRCETACNLNDLYATCAALVGESVAEGSGEDSFNMLPLLQGTPEKYLRNGMVHHDFIGRFAFRDGPWKLVMSKAGKKERLYNLAEDPSEKENVIGKHPELAACLKQQLTRIIRQGRSTPGPALENDGPSWWPELHWIEKGEAR